jgi:hypothetical protein
MQKYDVKFEDHYYLDDNRNEFKINIEIKGNGQLTYNKFMQDFREYIKKINDEVIIP